MSEQLRKEADFVILGEKLRANKEHPPRFNSPHEGYAVILEEYEEASEEQRYFKSSLDSLWIAVRSDRNPDVLERILNTMKERAINLVMEAIQVAAMTQKMIDTVEGMGDV